MYEICSGLAFTPMGCLLYVDPTGIDLIIAKWNNAEGVINLTRETVIIESGGDIFCRKMCRLVERIVEMLVAQLTTGAHSRIVNHWYEGKGCKASN